MNPIKRYIIWLRRMSYSRGFGVQSPSAYRFIRYVISEHYPYYAYADLRKKYPTLNWLTRKRMELYFRLANFCRTKLMVDYSKDSSLLADYVAHGCKMTKVRNVVSELSGDDAVDDSLDDVVMRLVRICPVAGCEAFLEKALAESDQSSVFVIEDISSDGVAHRMWQQLVESEKVSVSYDLYYCGIAFFDTDRHKTNYVVNF